MTDASTPASDAAEQTATAPAAPLLRVVNPDATPQEIAALVAVFSALGGDEAPKKKARSQWASPNRAVRRTLSHAVGGWRSSALPR